MQNAKNLSEYNDELREALENTFLRGAMDKWNAWLETTINGAPVIQLAA